MKTRRITLTLIAMVAILAAVVFGTLALRTPASAGPEIIGNPNGAVSRAIVTNGEQIERIEYFAAGVKTMVGANTPVASDPQCGLAGDLHKAEVQFVGTMAGTAPTLAIKWQNSLDGGLTWTDVGTWTTINATVTPATQSQVVADIRNAATAVAYGDCWRSTYVFGGTGTVTASFGVNGIDK